MIQLLLPMMGPVTQEWSYQHPAIDIACSKSIPVLAAHDGVGKSTYHFGLGNVMRIYGENDLVTTYAHLESTRGNLTYKRGDVIGYCGNTGEWTTGPHLHFESNQPYRFE